MVTADSGTLDLWVLQTLDRRSCTQSELNERRSGRRGDISLYQVLCQFLRQGLISRDAGLPRYRAPYHLTGAGRRFLQDLEEDQIAHHLSVALDRVYTDLFSLAVTECSGISPDSGAVLISSKRPDLLLTERGCDLLASLVKDERSRYLVTPALLPIPVSATPLVSSLSAIDLPPVSLDLMIIPVPEPGMMETQVQEINRLLSIRGMLVIALPFSAGAGPVSPVEDLIRGMVRDAPWFRLEEEMALIRTLDLYFDVYCLRHNRSALLICRRWGTGPETGSEDVGDIDDQIYPCRVVEVND